MLISFRLLDLLINFGSLTVRSLSDLENFRKLPELRQEPSRHRKTTLQGLLNLVEWLFHVEDLLVGRQAFFLDSTWRRPNRLPHKLPTRGFPDTEKLYGKATETFPCKLAPPRATCERACGCVRSLSDIEKLRGKAP